MPIGTPSTLGSNLTTTANATSLTITTTAAIIAGNLVVVAFFAANSSATPSISSVSDGTNAYTKATSDTFTGGNDHELWYVANAAAVGSGASLTLTFSTIGASGFAGAVAAQVSGVALTSAYDSAGVGTSGPVGSGINITTGTLAQPSEICFGSLAYQQIVGNFTEDTNFTNLYNYTVVSGTVSLSLGYKIVSSTAAITYLPSLSSASGNYGGIAAPFKAPQSLAFAGLKPYLRR